MLSAIALAGLLLGRGPSPVTTTQDVPTSLPASATPIAVDANNEMQAVPAETDSKDEPSIFGRPMFWERSSLSWIVGSGAGRFNIIDWESGPTSERMWGLSRWQNFDEVQIYTQIGFNIHWWSGPTRTETEAAPNLPPRVYDLYLDLSWSQRWSDRFTTEVRVQPGLYTDFRTTPPDAFRIPGQAIGLLQVTSDCFLVGGVEHLQRNDVQILPIAGVLWQPSPGCELRLVFPEPRVAVELSSRKNIWGYVAAEYGGGRWTHKNAAGHSERVEYSDYRVTFGIEWRKLDCKGAPLLIQNSSTFLELGYVFNRTLNLDAPAAAFEPTAAWMFRFGFVW